MLGKIKFKNSTILLIGILLISVGIAIGFLEYFQEKKEKVFSDMNLLLLENEIPINIDSESELKKIQEDIGESTNIDDDGLGQTIDDPRKYDYIGMLEIPKINLKRGFVDISSKYNNVNYNITVIKGSTFPDETNNNLILAAHSGACSICYFDRLHNLSLDDVAYLQYNGIKYYYKIVKIYEVEKDGTVPIYRNYKKDTLTLITCTRYSNNRQTVYILELYDKENI